MVDAKYTRVAMFLHWTTAALVVTLFVIGWTMVDLPKGPERGATFALHKSIGLTVFLLTAWRWCWRLLYPAPAFPASLAPWQATLARTVHALFYILLVAQPLTGYLSSSFSGYDTAFFGVPLPSWGHHNAPLNEFFTELHVLCSIALLATIALHVVGALSHVLKPGDRMVRRMLPWV
jgi:cytochrome b561